jgi:MoxR-like ATPase
VEKLADVKAKFDTAKKLIGQKIVGQDQVVEECMITMLSGGHALLNGVPGLAKTKLTFNLASVFGLVARKQQFTPDLMPQNLKGSEVLDEDENGKKSFRFIEGPVFANLFQADEFNRAGGRVQSGMLEIMEEQVVVVNGVEYKLPKPFHVLATQNPLDQEGTFPLTEANKDRFTMQINVHRPSFEDEKRIALGVGYDKTLAEQVFTPEDLLAMQADVKAMPVPDSVANDVMKLVRSTIPDGDASPMVKDYIRRPEAPRDGGAGVRASMAFMTAIRARAYIQGRAAPTQDDILAVALPILRHRLALSHKAKPAGETPDSIINKLTAFLRP